MHELLAQIEIDGLYDRLDEVGNAAVAGLVTFQAYIDQIVATNARIDYIRDQAAKAAAKAAKGVN